MADLEMTKVLVTGGTGFIGSNLVIGLVEKGYDVRVFDNNFRGKSSNLDHIKDKIEWVQGDIRNIDDVKKAVKGVHTVYHLAFVNGTENFYKMPELVLEVGVKGHLNIMDAVENEDSVKTFVYASSSEVYQNANVIPTPENIECIVPDVSNPRYSYGGGKLMGELLTLHYMKRTDVKKVIFRPHNIYGGSMGFEHVVPQLAKKIFDATENFSKESAEITIQGSGEETRAFCYVSDAVDGIIITGEKGEDGHVYHVGKEEEISIIDLVRKIGESYNIDLKINKGELLQGSTPRRCPDISKLADLGYTPTVTIEEGLNTTLDWYKNYYLNN